MGQLKSPIRHIHLLGWTKIEEKSPEFFFLNEPCKFFK